jgi:hypothetical protein
MHYLQHIERGKLVKCILNFKVKNNAGKITYKIQTNYTPFFVNLQH